MKRFSHVFIWAISLYFLLSACQPKTITISDAWARPGSRGGNSAVFFVINNPTTRDDSLMSARGDVALNIELHRTTMNQGVMKMEPQSSVMVPAESQMAFKPGDYHVMLINLGSDLRLGDSFPLVLTFENAGEITLQVRVKEE